MKKIIFAALILSAANLHAWNNSYNENTNQNSAYDQSRPDYDSQNSSSMRSDVNQNQQNFRNDNDNRNEKSYDDKYPQDNAATAQDREINKKIRDKITGWFTDDYKNVSFNTQNGNVTASGWVTSEKKKNKLLDEIRSINGIKNVNDQIQVKEKQ